MGIFGFWESRHDSFIFKNHICWHNLEKGVVKGKLEGYQSEDSTRLIQLDAELLLAVY